MDIICRWRDATTDPPPDGWRGLISNPDEGVTVWFRDYRGKHYVGDQWLDVTDVPAVAVAKVRDAVDEIHEIYINGAHDESRCADSAMDIIKAHTGVAHV